MNKINAKNLQNIISQLNELKNRLGDLQAEEEECLDSIPESMKCSERYERAEEACENLEDAVNGLEDVINILVEAME